MEAKNRMRRHDRALSLERSLEILEGDNFAVLGLALGDEPYCLPVNYVYHQDKIYIHSAQEGKKIDWFKHSNKVCFTVSHMLGVVQADTLCKYSAHFESIIVHGTAKVLHDFPEKREVIYAFARKFDADADNVPMLAEQLDRVAVIEIEIEEINGKARYN